MGSVEKFFGMSTFIDFICWLFDSVDLIAGLHCRAIRKYIRNRSMKEAKKMKCYNRFTLEKHLQVSGLCDASFLSYLPKRFT